MTKLEEMTEEQMEQLRRDYLALGLDIEDIYKEWKKVYDDEKGNA